MKRIEFETYEDFICEVADKLDAVRENDEYGDIAIIAKYNEANVIVRELLCMGYDIAGIHLGKEEFEEYWDEYIISITNVDGDTEVWCEPFKRDDKYITDESTITFVMDNCSSACIPNCKGKVVLEVGIGDKCDCSECCGNCDCDEEDAELPIESDGDMHGFSVNHSDDCGNYYYSFYSTDKDLVSEMARLFRR